MRLTDSMLAALEPRGQDLEEAVIDFVRAELPDHYRDVTPEGGDAMVRVGVRRARRWGFERTGDVMRFVAMMVEVSPSFDQEPALRRVLEGYAPRDGALLDALLEDRHAAAWERAALTADPDAWVDDEWLDAPPDDED